jgi:carbamoyltransferase
MAPVTILGISALYHNSAAVVLRDGEIRAAALEERFTRKKGDSRFPSKAIEYCLREVGIRTEELSAVGFYEKPLLKFERFLESSLGVAPRGFKEFRVDGPVWMKEKLWMDRMLRDELGGYKGDLFYAEHHESHAASAFYPSPFESAAVLTVDGLGEWATASYGVGRGADLEVIKEMRWPDSLGLLFSAVTYHAGFYVGSGEYKVMGLAPYGDPSYVQSMYEHLIDLKDDGSFRLNQEYFTYQNGLITTNERFGRLFGGPRRIPESDLTQREMDLARSLQEVCEEVVLRMARTAHGDTGMENLCVAGDVALNCVVNGRLLREGPFKQLWIQPAADDAGGALGAAKLVWHRQFQAPRTARHDPDELRGAYFGPEFTDEAIEAFLKEVGAVYHKLDRSCLLQTAARLLAEEKVVGWFNGRMEFGPRALGSRSILGDARSPRMQARMNLKIKFREGFRPFASSVLRERVAEYFEIDVDSPYMLLTAPVKRERQVSMSDEQRRLQGVDRIYLGSPGRTFGEPPEQLNIVRSDIPAVTHVDYSARVQTVSRDVNPDYYDLIREFEKLTACPVLLNTSFNLGDEPIVCTPKDAHECFMRTHIDALVLGPYLLHKDEQDEWKETGDWQWELPVA